MPVVIAESRAEVAPIIGYRHISGIEPWDAFAKARFIAFIVDREEAGGFDEVADLVGDSRTEVMSAYRNYKILIQGEKEFGLRTDEAASEFGVFTRAMSSNAVRNYIGAPQPRFVVRGDSPLPDNARRELRRLLVWLFGGTRSRGKVIGESRDLSRLGRVVASDDGLRVLVETSDLETAEEAIGGPRDRLVRRLTRRPLHLPTPLLFGTSVACACRRFMSADSGVFPMLYSTSGT